MSKYLSLLLILIFSSTTFAQNNDSKIFSEKELKTLEDTLSKKLTDTKLTNKQKFYVFLRVGRELYQYRYIDKSKKYYQDAIKINVDENKSEAYINIIAIDVLKKDKIQVKSDYELAKAYYDSHPKFKTKEIDYYFKSLEMYLPSNGKVENKEIIAGFFGAFASEENLINLIKSKDYDQAFSLISPKNLDESNNDFNIIVYDLLNVFHNKKSVKKLYCDKQFNQYPNSFAYSTILCGLINDYLKTNDFSAARIKMADVYFKKENTDKLYLYDLAQEIKK
jgi:hypothetical protein